MFFCFILLKFRCTPAVYMQEGEKGIKEEKIEIEWVEGKRW